MKRLAPCRNIASLIWEVGGRGQGRGRSADCACRGPWGRPDETMNYDAVPSLTRLFFDQAAKLPRKPLLRHKVDGAWIPMTYGEAAARVRALARGLIGLGIVPGDRVALIS